MKKTLSIIAGLLMTAVSLAQESINPEFLRLIEEDRTRAAVNMNSFEFNPIVDTPAPKGFKPFYISHFGRHGSRSNWGSRDYDAIINVLSKADAKGILTDEGKALLEETQTILSRYNGMDGRLTARGVREHRMIAEHMYKRFPEVFKKGSKYVEVECSTVPRCIISMASFTNSLSSCQSDLRMSFDTGEKIFAYLNNDRSKEQAAKENEMLAPLYKVPEDTTWILSHLFTDTVEGKGLITDITAFQKNIWETAAIGEDFDIPGNMFRHLPFDVVLKYWDILNRRFYLGHCNSVEFGPDRLERARPLIDDVVSKADHAIATGEVCANLRFAHDYGFLSLVSYLGLEGVGERLSFDEIPQHWFGAFMVPMAANLQIIFYRHKGSDRILVKFVQNEKECRLRNLDPVSGPYYDWAVVRENLAGYKR